MEHHHDTDLCDQLPSFTALVLGKTKLEGKLEELRQLLDAGTAVVVARQRTTISGKKLSSRMSATAYGAFVDALSRGFEAFGADASDQPEHAWVEAITIVLPGGTALSEELCAEALRGIAAERQRRVVLQAANEDADSDPVPKPKPPLAAPQPPEKIAPAQERTPGKPKGKRAVRAAVIKSGSLATVGGEWLNFVRGGGQLMLVAGSRKVAFSDVAAHFKDAGHVVPWVEPAVGTARAAWQGTCWAVLPTSAAELELRSLYVDHVMKQDRGAWTIVVDETKKDKKLLVALVVQPDTTLEPNYCHATNVPATSERWLEKLLASIESGGVKAFAFDWTDFGHANGLGGIARAENLGVWQQTLPFVLEHVALAIAAAEDSETVWPVRVYVEQANEIKSGSPILAGMVRQLMEHHGHRPGWDRMQLDDPQVVGKSDHGWTAYADNLAHALVVPRKYAPELRARLDEHVVRIDIAKDSLAALRDVLALDGRDPTGMVESAAQRIDATTFHAARSLLVPAFQRAARALNGRPDGWSGSLVKSLGTLLAQRQETHAVIHALLREVDIDAILQHRDEPHGRDVFCAALNGALYAAVQQAERRRADELLGRWDDAVSEWSGAGWEPLQDTADHQAALRANAMMNRFAFVEALRVVDERLTARGGTGGRDPDLAALYGTRVQALAHLGRVDETNATLREYERHLDSARDRQRLACYRADACLVGLVATPAAASAGLAVIAKAAPLLRPGRGGPSPLAAAAAASPWLRRTALSCLWYCGSMRPKGWEALLDMPVVSGHPAEMIAFWEGALLSAKGRVKEAEERMRILVSLAHEAPGDSAGVRLLCYLNALAALGVRGCSAGDLGAIEGAICASSAPSTLEWLDDRRLLAACLSPFDRALAPLTFNNR